VTSILVGARRPEQLEQLVTEALRLPADDELWRSLDPSQPSEESRITTLLEGRSTSFPGR
jgi:aryl-alcohol dehydrogenase-like predicted oxidoreductase